MRISIRLKIGVLLIAAGAIPLTAALGVNVLQERRSQTRVFGQAQQTVALAVARRIESSLKSEIDRLFLALQRDPHTGEEWLLASPSRAYTQDELDALDGLWPTLAEDDPRIVALKMNDVGEHLQALQETFPEMAEVFVTDRYGQLVAATGVTEDFYQADEDWWTAAYNDGVGCVHVGEVELDASAGVMSIDVSLPLFRDDELVGIVKMVLNLSAWLDKALVFSEFGTVGGIMAEAEGLVIDGEGNVIFAKSEHGPHWSTAEWVEIVGSGAGGWRLSPEGMLQGYSRIPFGESINELGLTAPRWSVVLQIHRPSLLAQLDPWTWRVSAVGVGIICVIYVLGLFVADRSLGHRIRKLQSVAKIVSNGVFTNELKQFRPHHLLGKDEIDELIAAFDRMIDSVADSHEELARANELKTSFIQVAGHELRTPISYIMALPRLMERTNDVDKLHEGMRTMEAKARRLSDIIQSMFKLMPEEAFSDHLNREDVPLGDLLDDIYEDGSPFAEERHQKLVIEPHAGELPVIHVDREKIRDAVQNLLGNAIKFTPDGGEIRIRTTVFADERVAMTIIDEGPGILEADLKNVFNPFYSTSDVMKHSSGSIGETKHGMGLGLAVARHFAEMHGGEITVESSPQGSAFTITLPVGQSS